MIASRLDNEQDGRKLSSFESFWHIFYAVNYTFKLEKMFTTTLHSLHHRTSQLCFKLSNLLLLALHGWPRPPFFWVVNAINEYWWLTDHDETMILQYIYLVLKLHFSTCKYISTLSKNSSFVLWIVYFNLYSKVDLILFGRFH